MEFAKNANIHPRPVHRAAENYLWASRNGRLSSSYG